MHIAYLTAWVNKDGTVHFRNDVYGATRALPPPCSARVAGVADRRLPEADEAARRIRDSMLTPKTNPAAAPRQIPEGHHPSPDKGTEQTPFHRDPGAAALRCRGHDG